MTLDAKGRIVVSACLVAVLSGCGPNTESDVQPWPRGDGSYSFDEPAAYVELPSELDEISGLAVMDDGRIAAVQDEDGILYVIDASTGRIVEERTFGGPGDYEAVSLAQERLYVLRSDGVVLRFDSWSGTTLDGEEITFDLPNKCDAEGLRYDEEDGWLLVSCKENPGSGLSAHDKAVYAFDLEGGRVSEQPIHVLDVRTFSESIDDHPVNKSVRAVLSERVDLSGFKPSDLAVHPVTGELFMLSSVREALLSLRRDGTVTGVWKLSDPLLDQPEGLDFLPNGDLYISSEAGDKPQAVLARFDYRSVQQPPAE